MTNDETQDVDFSQALEDYLDQHDYKLPRTGDIRRGTIVDISNEGIIVDLGLKRDGLIPPSDLAKLSAEEREELEVDQEIPVYILSASESDSLQVSLHRAYLNDDWIKAQDYMDNGDIIEATVVGYNRGGALVEYGRLRGFVPLSQLSTFRPGMPDREKQRMLSKLRDEKLPLKIIEVDRRRRRLVMSNREAHKEWLSARRAEKLETLNAGDTISGKVSSLRDFGAFVDIGDGIEGLVHVSELAWYRIDHPNEVIKAGDEFDVYVLKVDRESQRISLSRKRLLPDPWSTIEDRYDVGQLVDGIITRIVDYGAFVEIEPGIEGLLHMSKLTRTEVSNPGEVVREGEQHLLRIISIDTDRQRIGLSLKAVTAKEQIDWMMQQEEGDGEAEEEATAEVEIGAEAVAEEASSETSETAESVAEAVETEASAETKVEESAAAEESSVEETEAEEAPTEETVAEDNQAAEVEVEEAPADEESSTETEAEETPTEETIAEDSPAAEALADEESSTETETEEALTEETVTEDSHGEEAEAEATSDDSGAEADNEEAAENDEEESE